MQDKILHIIAFDNPEPPVYGGVIDVYYRIRALYRQGVKVILHIWEYNNKAQIEELGNWCQEIYFYPRIMRIVSHLSVTPFIVESRTSDALLNNLLKDKSPILFEGIHACGVLSDKALLGRKKIVRIHNIEHHYYTHLFYNEHNILKKSFFLLESIKLKLFERILKSADYLLAISKSDLRYLEERFPAQQSILFPGFHPNDEISSKIGRGTYLLYHGNLEVSENIRAAHFLIEKVFSKINIPLIIAGRNPSASLYEAVKKYKNMSLISNPSSIEMADLVQNAQVHILYTFQDTGLKLKLLNTLFQGRHVLVNSMMLRGTGLAKICSIADKPEDLIAKTKTLFQQDFSVVEIENRKAILGDKYSNSINARILVELL